MNKVEDDTAAKNPKPIVIDRYHFKHDEDGYLSANSPSICTWWMLPRATSRR